MSKPLRIFQAHASAADAADATGGDAQHPDSIRQQIARLVEAHFARSPSAFIPGKTLVPYAGAIFDQREVMPMIDSLLRGWLGVGARAHELERALPKLLGKTLGVVTNSGSSANLLALCALRSTRAPRPLLAGDEVITCALGFPTTVNPIIQNGLVPVFVDAESGSHNIDPELVARAISPRTRAIAFAHALGNPADVEALRRIAAEHELLVLEDCCDALESELDGQPAGTFGDLATVSFYPSHHMTMGEGGFVATNDPTLATIVRSLRDWGRDCHCVGRATLLETGSCGHRFDTWLGDDIGVIDHKYVYSEVGYNLKPLELQCAMGLAQLTRLSEFTQRRRENFNSLYGLFSQYQDWFELPVWLPTAKPNWFAFPLTVKREAPFTRSRFAAYLEQRRIATRPLFAGNLLRHPAYRSFEHRVVGELPVADKVLRQSLFLGVYPGISEVMMNHVLETCADFLRDSAKGELG